MRGSRFSLGNGPILFTNEPLVIEKAPPLCEKEPLLSETEPRVSHIAEALLQMRPRSSNCQGGRGSPNATARGCSSPIAKTLSLRKLSRWPLLLGREPLLFDK